MNKKKRKQIKISIIALVLIAITFFFLTTSTLADNDDVSSIIGISETPQGTSQAESSSEESKAESSTEELVEVNIAPGYSVPEQLSTFASFVDVNNFAELKLAINSGKTEIRLKANINMLETLYISTDLVLDGGGFTLSETSNKYIFGVNSNNIGIIFQNMTILGYNYYGTVSTAIGSGGENVMVTYSNVVYNGPQLIYAIKNNTLIIENSEINLRSNGVGTNPVQELAQVSHIVLAGDVKIVKHEGSDALIWFYNAYAVRGASFTVRSGANAIVQNPQTYFMYNDVVTIGVDFIIEDNANLNMETYAGWSYNTTATHAFRNLTVGANAYVELIQTKSSHGSNNNMEQGGVNGSTFNIKGSIGVSENAVFIIRNRDNPTLGQLYLVNNMPAVNITNPKLVYISGKVYGYKANSVNISAKAVNVWAGGGNPQSDYPWIVANVESGVANDLVPSKTDELINIASISSKFNYFAAPAYAGNRVYTGTVIGQYDFALEPLPSLKDTVVTGVSVPGTATDLSYVHDSLGAQQTSALADAGGKLEYTVLPGGKGEGLTFSIAQPLSNVPNLKIYSREIWGFAPGVLELKEVPNIAFGVQSIPVIESTFARIANAQILVTDSRTGSEASSWSLTVQASPFTGTNAGGLPYIWGHNALGYMNSGVFQSLQNPVSVWEGLTTTEQEQALIWSANDITSGIVLRLNGTEEEEGEYAATLTWRLQVAP